jgi:hypothetical protein
MGLMTPPKPLIIIIWTCQEMMVWMSMELIGPMDIIRSDFGSEVGKIFPHFCHSLTTNQTQHDSHGSNEYPKTIDYHHLDMPRDDGMDEHGIDWPYGCHQVGFWLRS